MNLVLMVLTAFSVLFSGLLTAAAHNASPIVEDDAALFELPRDLPLAALFALALLAILGAHELGHYFAARLHKTRVTLPYFIPFPGSILGTLGAFIRFEELPRNRRVLFDIALAGPLAGLFVALPILLVGLTLSAVGPLPANAASAAGISVEGNSLLYVGVKYLVKGQLLPAPKETAELSSIAYWIRYFITGEPIPWGGLDVELHPLAFAGWAGLLVTAFNLIPVGQLDGGHILYSVLGPKVIRTWPLVVLLLLLLGYVWRGWWLWGLLIFLLGQRPAMVRDEITGIDRKRQLLAILGLIVLVLVFIPVPFRKLG